MTKDTDDQKAVTRRSFFRATAATGAAGALALAAGEAEAQQKWDRTADVVIIGAGTSGLAAAVTARDNGASVLMVELNTDIGGHGMVSGGRIHLGGGHYIQQKLGIKDNPEQVFTDWVRHDNPESRFNDRDIVRVYADETLPTFQFLLDNGVEFIEKPIGPEGADSVPRQFQCKEWHIPEQVVAPRRGRNGSGLVRRLEESARKKGAEILLRHRMTKIVRENPASGRVLGVEVESEGKIIRIGANKGVIVATGGHTGNVNFRRMFDPRLTEEYQEVGAPWTYRNGDGERAAMAVGAALWAAANQTTQAGAAISKTRHLGAQWGSAALVFEPDSPIFKDRVRATGITIKDWQNAIMVKETGKRFWNEDDSGYDFFAAAMSYTGDSAKRNGGGPIWAIFDAEAVKREEWTPEPPYVNPDGYFAKGETLQELAANIKSQYQRHPMPGDVLAATVERYNSFVDSGVDADFGKPTPLHKIQTPPFYAAWATPIIHDSLTGLRTTMKGEVIDMQGAQIPGLYCCGESMGGFAQHGLARCLVFGRMAGRAAATA